LPGKETMKNRVISRYLNLLKSGDVLFFFAQARPKGKGDGKNNLKIEGKILKVTLTDG